MACQTTRDQRNKILTVNRLRASKFNKFCSLATDKVPFLFSFSQQPFEQHSNTKETTKKARWGTKKLAPCRCLSKLLFNELLQFKCYFF